jgi:hypothetical protein
MARWICVGIAVAMLAVVGVAEARKSRRSHGASHSASQLEEGMYFFRLTHQAIEGGRLIDKGDSTLRVLIGPSGQDGVRIRLDHGATALRLDAAVANADSLPDGAWLEFGARVSGAKDSVGFLRMTRTGAGDYAMSGAVAGASGQTIALYRSGAEVYRDTRPAVPVADLVHGHGCLLCGFSSNDDVGRPSKAAGFVLLRAWWSQSHEFTVVNRPGGASDSTLTADEIRILPASGAGAGHTLSEFVLRGKALGELRIFSEQPTRP